MTNRVEGCPGVPHARGELASDLSERVVLDFVRYASCWEDADVLCEALRPTPGRRIVSVASGGDNSFALAAEGADVVAADLSAAQIACVELKRAAFRRLEYGQVLAFLGVEPSDDRRSVYERLEPELSEWAEAFWRAHRDDVERGIIHCGKFEGYFRLFRRHVLPLVHGRRTVEALLAERTRPEREAFYERRWNSVRWRLMFRVFFSRFVMGRLGRDPEFFRYVEGSVSERILERTRYAFTVLPTHANPYLEYVLTGRFRRALPRYLRPERFDAVRDGLDRLTLFVGPVEEAAVAHRGPGFDGFNLSDIFEYLDPATVRHIYATLLDAARPGARLAYWNMLAPRSCPPEHSERVSQLEEEARRLFEKDLAFFYSAFVLEQVRG